MWCEKIEKFMLNAGFIVHLHPVIEARRIAITHDRKMQIIFLLLSDLCAAHIIL